MSGVKLDSESRILAKIRLRHGSRLDCLIERVTTGVFAVADKHGKIRRVKTAPSGTPDLRVSQLRRVMRVEDINASGYMPHRKESWHYYNQTIYVECKTKSGKLSKEQKAFRRMALKLGCEFVVARDEFAVDAVLGREPEWVRDWQDRLPPPYDEDDTTPAT